MECPSRIEYDLSADTLRICSIGWFKVYYAAPKAAYYAIPNKEIFRGVPLPAYKMAHRDTLTIFQPAKWPIRQKPLHTTYYRYAVIDFNAKVFFVFLFWLILFMFIAFECLALRVVIIDDKKYWKFTFEDFLAAISTRNVSFKTLKRVYICLFSFYVTLVMYFSFNLISTADALTFVLNSISNIDSVHYKHFVIFGV